MKLWLKNHLWKVPILLGLFWILNEIRIDYRFGHFLAEYERENPGWSQLVFYMDRSDLEELISYATLVSFAILTLLNLVVFRNMKALISVLIAGIMFFFLLNGGIFPEGYFI